MENMLKTKMEEVFLGAKTLNYRSGEIIVRAGESPQYVYYIQSGFVRIYLLNEDGQELTLYVMGPGLIFSMVWALADIPNHYNFEAIMPTKVSYIPNKTFFDFVEKNQQLLMELMKINLYSLDGIITRMESLISGQASHKVAAAILFASQYFNCTKTHKNLINNLPVTHNIIASFAGLTRETTSIEMKKLEREKIISYKRRALVINDLEALKRKTTGMILEIGGGHPPGVLD